jgi:hypothetical protein
MAGERKGKTYEAMAYAALTLLGRKDEIDGEVFWNQKPAGMSIEPDLTIGEDKDHPDTCILITQSGSAKNSDMKSWRNLGELVESKTVFEKLPRVLSLVFDAVIKEELKKVQEAAFDGQLIVGDLDYGDGFQAWVDANLNDLPTHYLTKSAKILELYDSKSDPELRKLLDRLAADLAKLVAKTNPPMEQLWKLERARVKGTAPKAKTTYVRRGSSALLVVQDPKPFERLYGGKKVQVEEIPEYAYALGFADKFGSIAQPASKELQNLFDLFRSDLASLDRILKSAPMDKIEGWIQTLRNLNHLVFMGEYVLEEYDNLRKPEELARQFLELHDNPDALVDQGSVPEDWNSNSVWLYEVLLHLSRAFGGTSTSDGYAQIASRAAALPGMPPASNRVYTIVLSDWLRRQDIETMPNEVLFGLAVVLSGRLSEIPKSKLAELIRELASSAASNILEAKLMTYRGFEPLAVLIEFAVKGAKRVAIKSCFAEAGGIGGQAGKTTILKAKNTLINWQSCSDAGRDHKKKELCGRAVALRYTWDAVSKTFKPRPGVSKLILVLDGTWRQSDLDALLRAGWDEIYYPDEMDKLAKAIV